MAGPARRRRRSASEEQRQLAEGWLRRLGRPVSPEAIESLAPHVKLEGKPELIEIQAFTRLIRLGQVPTGASVKGEMAALQAHQARLHRQKEQVRAVADAMEVFGEAVATRVAEHRAEAGRSPTWKELRRRVGWSQEVLEDVMPRLRTAGWVTYDPQPGSLRPGPAYWASQDGRRGLIT